MKKSILLTIAFAIALSSCKNPKTETMELKEIETLFEHLETTIEFGKTSPTELRKYNDIGEGDEHGNYFLKWSNLDGTDDVFCNFSFEEDKLAYITYKASINPNKIKDFIIKKYGEGKILSKDYKNRTEWKTEKFNINLDTQNTPWSLNIEPKDYYPGF